MQRLLDGVLVDLTADEITERQAEEAAWAAGANDRAAYWNRKKRDDLLLESDWTQMNDSPLTNEVKTAWAVYRDELRNITNQDYWPHMSDEDWPVSP